MYYTLKNLIMFKKFVTIAVVAIVIASCTQNEMEEINVTTSDAITLSPNTAITRASIATVNTLQASTKGFVVYATGGTAPTNWLTDIDGTNNHVYKGGKWVFESTVPWPSEASKYPMDFYALYPGGTTNQALQRINADEVDKLSIDVTIPAEVADQVDLLATKNRANSKPFSSNLGLAFKHILTKVDFSVSNVDTTGLSASADQHVFVMAVGFKNLYTTNSYDMISETWNTINTGAAQGDYNYFNAFDVLQDPETYTEKEFVSANEAKFYSTPDIDAAHMMLMPQTANFWPVAPDQQVNTPTDDQAYIKVFYRVTKDVPGNPGYEDLIGYQTAESHLNYETSELKDRGYKGSLYVLVGFKYNTTWVNGKGYIYDIPLPGKTGGRLLDKYYYDNQGRKTDLEVGETGTTVVSEDNDIHLIPSVIDWDDQNPIDVFGK